MQLERGEFMNHIETENIKKENRNSYVEIIPTDYIMNKALQYATEKHKGQFRRDGSEYIIHPTRVANYVAKFKISNHLQTLISSAYLHDTIEDTDTTYYDIINTFGSQIASIVLELTTDEDLKKEIGKARYLSIKMKNMSSWALVIKLCDRLDNVSDLNNAPKEFRERYTKETIEILKYIIDNRKLSLTHINIIKEILHQLNLLNQLSQEQNKNLKLLSKKITI